MCQKYNMLIYISLRSNFLYFTLKLYTKLYSLLHLIVLLYKRLIVEEIKNDHSKDNWRQNCLCLRGGFKFHLSRKPNITELLI